MASKRNQHLDLAPVPCDREDCDALRSARAKSGLCRKHQRTAYMEGYRGGRKRMYSDSGELLNPCSYDTAHMRVRRARGDAANQACVGTMEGPCPENRLAAEWSYNNVCDYEQRDMGRDGDYPRRWSPLVSAYDPRCKKCHYQYDRVEMPAEMETV